MKEKIISISLLIIVGCSVEFGLASVFIDTAYRANSATIQSIAGITAIFFPIFIALGFFKQFTKLVASVAAIISLLCMTYLFTVYGLKMVNGNQMTLISVGFIVTAILIGRLLFFKQSKHKKDEQKELIIE